MKQYNKLLARLAQRIRRVRYGIEAALSLLMAAIIRPLPPVTAINFMAGVAQNIGPFLPRHRIALDNLARAYPDMPEPERRQIARRMWRNMGRQAAEYLFLDRIVEFDPFADPPGQIEVEGVEVFKRIHASGKPVIFFTGHTGNFELLPICAGSFGLEVTALFRPPNNPYLAKRLLSARTTQSGLLVPAKAGAAAGLARALDEGRSVGVLVDQKFARGRPGTFFGQPVKTNPLLPRLARQFGCAVHPARCIRLAQNRFRLELEDAIDLPRDADGRIDIDASTQMLNDVVERWVREYPDQWMWLHRRWGNSKHRAARRGR